MTRTGDFLLVSNNPLVREVLGVQQGLALDFRECSLHEILTVVRDYVHTGHLLYTHPLSGSVKPNETPYKTIVVSQKVPGMEFDHAQMMSDAIVRANSFPPLKRRYGEEVLRDFQLIDYCLVCGALDIDPQQGLASR